MVRSTYRVTGTVHARSVRGKVKEQVGRLPAPSDRGTCHGGNACRAESCRCAVPRTSSVCSITPDARSTRSKRQRRGSSALRARVIHRGVRNASNRERAVVSVVEPSLPADEHSRVSRPRRRVLPRRNAEVPRYRISASNGVTCQPLSVRRSRGRATSPSRVATHVNHPPERRGGLLIRS